MLQPELMCCLTSSATCGLFDCVVYCFGILGVGRDCVHFVKKLRCAVPKSALVWGTGLVESALCMRIL
jgi:hypothetical protein